MWSRTLNYHFQLQGIEREFSFNFYDLEIIKAKHSYKQNGRFENEFVEVVTDKNSSGRKTTQIIFAMHIRDMQIYAIKKVAKYGH